MTTRKPKLNLLYATDSSMPWLQLAVVTAEPNPSQQHARHWQAVRFAGAPATGQPSGEPTATAARKH
jgi:hypothetical protein